MKTLIALLLLAFVQTASAAESPTIPALPAEVGADRLPGVELAQGISEITGTAVSPLLGVSAVGAWKYYRTPEAQRDKLPWYCHPYVWGMGFSLLALCFLKDSLGTIAPAIVKKPLDMLELFENKISALVASAAFVPLIASEMARHLKSPDQAMLMLPGGSDFLPMAMIGFDFRILLVPICLASFLVVWITSHAINVLITLCPFGFIDALLKLARMSLLALLVVTYSISPYVGAALSVLIIAVAAWCAPWAFRLTVFGAAFASDTILSRRARRRATPAEPHAFIAQAAAGVPSRTYGRIVRSSDGVVQFKYRPWLVLPSRTVQLPTGRLAISKGVFFPSLLVCDETSSTTSRVCMLLPRYRAQEEVVAGHLDIQDLRDSPLTKGFKAMKNWLSEVFVSSRRKWTEIRTSALSLPCPRP